MLTEYMVKKCKYPRKAPLSGPFITLRLDTARTVQNLLDVLNTVYEYAATMLEVEEMSPR
jgi:hypothetical protein